ncbi:carboxymuconolactone decarboxylase family protein [Tardiphaga sp. 709]|uniref:carboxymuconolactone decarboxylase family protein n=1 Tax=Tardiphaga sp. 709 TaxID=3076039 RepID=UPI0028F01EAB|nr:carboxymuconolactone decarboxylase family protein [Tardiphaga sp. 709]WNV11577.1 carboxymuconolactone decarboxylase family protein [Tardiphaga sp. 709]
MSRLPLLTIENAPNAAKAGLQTAQINNGFLPNLVRLLANAPAALETYQTVSAINARSGLNLAEREVVQITAAVTHGCGFCVAGHTAIAYKKAGLSEAVVEALRDGRKVLDDRLNAVADFTRAVIRSRGAVSDAEVKAFRAAGFTDANALEVVLGVSLATLCNFANNLGQPPLNDELRPYAWTNASAAAAE